MLSKENQTFEGAINSLAPKLQQFNFRRVKIGRAAKLIVGFRRPAGRKISFCASVEWAEECGGSKDKMGRQ